MVVHLKERDPVKRKFGGNAYTLVESSGNVQTCIKRGNELDNLGHTHRIIDKIDKTEVSGHKYLLYVSDKKRGG